MIYMWWSNPNCNPHGDVTSRTDISFTRRLHWDAPRVEYRDDQSAKGTHWGQRKLLMSEIEFLTRHGSRSQIVVYAGAAPGVHMRALQELFEDHVFVLVDPAPFSVDESHSVSLIKEPFTDELATQFAAMFGGDMLFISDIRSSGFVADGAEKHEQSIRKDMQDQMRWHSIMKPVKSMLKFRLPFESGSTVYLDGDIMLPVWGPVGTAECRLIADRNAGVVAYDHTRHEQQMFHFNTVARIGLYNHDIKGEGIDHCFDCMSEIHILKTYLLQSGCPRRRLQCCVSMLSRRLSRLLSKRRTLECSNP